MMILQPCLDPPEMPWQDKEKYIATGHTRQIFLWVILGWYDILARYRSTTLGILWIVIINAMTVFAIGFVFASLFGIELYNYFPYLGTGYIFWIFISSSIVELSGSLTSYRFILHSHAVIPMSVLIRVLVRNLVILLHNLPIIIALLVLYSNNPWPQALLFMPNFLLVTIIMLSGCGFLAFACARFRDIQMLINAAVGVLFLITPIIWSPEILTERAYIAYLNPLTHILDILRKPLLGEIPSLWNYGMSLGIAFICIVLFFLTYQYSKKKYIFWL